METLIYFLKANLYITVFYVCYRVLLRKHTFFKLNRLYLLSTLLFSFLLPSISFTDTIQLLPAQHQILAEPSGQQAAAVSATQTSWLHVILIFYAIGALYMLVTLLHGFGRIILLVKQADAVDMGSYKLILLPATWDAHRKPGSFSFLNFLVISNHDYENCFDTILRHELVHIGQRHSYDIFFVEILKVLCWFNPALWLYKYSVTEIHEFLADQHVDDKEAYASFLVSYAQRSVFGSMTNNFFNSYLLKDRIIMIYRKSTSNWSLTKYFLVVLVITFTVMRTAAHKQIIIKPDRKRMANLSVNRNEPVASTVRESLPERRKEEIKRKIIQVRLRKPIAVIDTVIEKGGDTYVNYTSRVSEYRDSLWERYDPKAGQINYYNKAKIKRVKPIYPALQKYGKEFGNVVDLSRKEAPRTDLEQWRIGLKRPDESRPSTIKMVVP